MAKRTSKERQLAAIQDRLVWIAQGAIGGTSTDDPDDIYCELGDFENLGRFVGAIVKSMLASLGEDVSSWQRRFMPWEFELFGDFEKLARELYQRGVRVKLDS